jgi:multisubunit Na+/H+ antiporter MnhG subunit
VIEKKPAKSGLAVPTLYLVLATVAAAVQWNKWQALRHTRNLVALVLSLLIMVVAATYMARAFTNRRSAGL